jgi:hypothetical protein
MTLVLKEKNYVIGVPYSKFRNLIKDKSMLCYIKGQSIFSDPNFDTAVTFAYGYCLEHSLYSITIVKCEFKNDRIYNDPTVFELTIKQEVEKWIQQYGK